MNLSIDVEKIRDEIIQRRITWESPDYGQRYLDAINVLSEFKFKTTIVDEYIKQLQNIKFYIDQNLREHQNREVTDFRVFIQSWPTTSLGFNSFGNNVETDSITTVVVVKDNKINIESAIVFFDGKFAYEYPMYENLKIDISRRTMRSVRDAQIEYSEPF